MRKMYKMLMHNNITIDNLSLRDGGWVSEGSSQRGGWQTTGFSSLCARYTHSSVTSLPPGGSTCCRGTDSYMRDT